MDQEKRKRVVVMGGGTGTYTVLTGLKRTCAVDLTAIISMADNGGSSGTLRDELGVLPPGDLRQAIVALAETEDKTRTLFMHRMSEGTLNGHPLGNLLISTLSAILEDPIKAIAEVCRILNVQGKIIPVTTQATDLTVHLEDGEVINGEHAIDNATEPRAAIRHCKLTSPVDVNPDALEAIRTADLIVLGPGDLYTSVIPILLVDGIKEALAESKGRLTYIVNLMTKRGQTDGFKVSHFRDVVQAHCDPAKIRNIIVNTEVPSDELLALYEKEGEFLVQDDLVKVHLQRISRWPLISNEVTEPVKGDVLRRSLFRHDPNALAAAILSFIRE
ncbi:MAG: gluconeogenesis factor YvcK family protein [Patescibacteria group bacterium]|jgi:uncharacterized cofD-like protein